MIHHKSIAMATKMFPKSFTYFRSLNSRSNLAVCRTNPRCLSIFSQQRWRKAGGINRSFSKNYFEGEVGLHAVSPKTESIGHCVGWHQRLQPPWHLSKTWLSGSSFVSCVPRDEHENNWFSTSETTDSHSSVLHTDTSGVSTTDNIEINAQDDEVLMKEKRNSDSVTDSISTENIHSADCSETRRQPTRVNSALVNSEIELSDDLYEDDVLAVQDSPMVLEEFIKPFLPPESLTLTSYADHSVTLQKLVELGVDLSKVEKKAHIGNALLKMDFEKDIKDKIIFLHDVGILGEGLGRFLTINPFVLTEELQNLEARIGYLRGKMFSEDAITRVLTRAPFFISFSVERVDSKLGFYQKELSLTGDELRSVITKTPKLVTFKVQHIKENLFVIRQQLGFTRSELKKLILADPRVLLRGKRKLISTFDLLHNHMGIPHKQLLKNPQVFNGRVFKLQERHQFLKMLGLDQYNPTQPGYISTENLSKVPDDIFAQEIAKCSVSEYNTFLKSL